jgi:hypothetical protein
MSLRRYSVERFGNAAAAERLGRLYDRVLHPAGYFEPVSASGTA